MAQQIPRIKCMWVEAKRRTPLVNFISIIFAFCILVASIQRAQSATCPNSVPSSAAIITEECSISSSTTITHGVAGGLVSNSLYYLYYLPLQSINAIVRKVDVSGSQTWIASFAFNPNSKSLSVDASEKTVYLSSCTQTLVVLCLSASNGAIKSQQSFTNISGVNYDIKTWPLADLSGYFVIGKDSSETACVCIFTNLNAQCQSVTNIKYGSGHLMITQNQFFLLGVSPTPPNALHMYKLTFSSTSVDWANMIACSAASCSSFDSESLLSTSGLNIYLFFIYGSIKKFCYFASVSVSDGSVTSLRYKSSEQVQIIYGSALNGDYAIATTSSPLSLIIYTLSSSVFIIKSYSGSNLYGCGVETPSGRFIVTGAKGLNGYITKFVPQSIGSNSDFSNPVYAMNALSTGTDDIISESGVIIGNIRSIVIDAGIYTNLSNTYTQVTLVPSDVYFQIKTQAFSVIGASNSSLSPDLPCSFSGTTSMNYSLSSYTSVNSPSFVSIDSSGVLNILAPNVSVSTDYTFSIISSVFGATGPVQNIIKLTIQKCTASNCQQCSTTDPSVCVSCSSGYSLSSGVCNLSQSETAKSLSTSSQVIIGATIMLCFASSLLNSSSMASLWSMINQTQIFFLLLLTGAFIPKDIELIITGLKICLNPFSYFQSSSEDNSNFVSNYFNFGLENSNLEKLRIKSDSTAANIYSFILSLIIISGLHLCIMIFQKLLAKESKYNCCKCILKITHWVLNKLMVLFTFALYIRIILKTNQFVLISCISEIYHFNLTGMKRLLSLVIAFISLFACIAMIVAVILFVFILNEDRSQESTDKRSKFAQLFNGVSSNKKSRLYVALLQLRRAIFITLLITVEPVSSIVVISILVGLQVIYLFLLMIIRPFELVKCNMIEILNEMYFLTILASLLKYNNITNWVGTPTTIYTWLISSNSISGFTIIIIDLIRKLIIKCKEKHCDNSSQPTQINQILPVAASRVSYALDEIEPSNIRINKISPTLNIQIDPTGRGHRIGNRFYVKR